MSAQFAAPRGAGALARAEAPASASGSGTRRPARSMGTAPPSWQEAYMSQVDTQYRQSPPPSVLRRSFFRPETAATACAIVTVSASQSAFSKLNTRPTDAAVYASRTSLRRDTQNSRSGWNRYLLSCKTLSFSTSCRFIPAHPKFAPAQNRATFARVRITHTNNSHLSGFGFVSRNRAPSLPRCGDACAMYTQAHAHASNVKSDQRSHH